MHAKAAISNMQMNELEQGRVSVKLVYRTGSRWTGFANAPNCKMGVIITFPELNASGPRSGVEVDKAD